MRDWNRYEDILKNADGVLFLSLDLLPVRQHQANEELLQKQKEFAALIYFEKDKNFRRCE